jgi:tetrapyrrole methylase family protein/MazG family protein
MPYNEEGSLQALKSVLNTVRRLRAPDGCPWDREQNHQSLRPYLLEETYETLEVLDQVKDPNDLNDPRLKSAFREEWGDVLLQILLHAEIASETHPDLSFAAIADTLNEKLIRRHPHVFGQTRVSNADEVIANWAEIKKAEKGNAQAPLSVFDSIPKGTAPLPRTMKVISKVTKVGFQWPDLKGPTEKLEEEVHELKEVLSQGDFKSESAREKIEGELGDLLFCVCNIAHFLKMDPEAALRSTLRKFESRFRHVETRLAEKGSEPSKSNLEEMDRLWDEAKAMERGKA